MKILAKTGASGILSNIKVVDFLAIQEANHFRYRTTYIDVRNGWLVRENACEPASQPKANFAVDKDVFMQHFAEDKIVPR